MLENGTRALPVARREQLLDLYAAELSPEQVETLVERFRLRTPTPRQPLDRPSAG